MPKAQIGDIQIYYEIHGAGEPVVMIMGASLTADAWWAQVPALSREFQVITFDNRGIGRTDAPEYPYSMEGFADDTAGLMEALGIDSADIVGASLGGMIAQELVLRHPAKVRSLALLCTTPGGPHRVYPTCLPEIGAADAALDADPDDPAVYRAFVRFMYGAETVESRPDFIEAQFRRRLEAPKSTPHGLDLQTQANRSWVGSYERLPLIKVPTLIVTGDQDVIVCPENSQILHERIPGSELVIIPGAGHGHFTEAAEATNEVLLSFLRRGSRR